jgi:ATP-dependent DNA ligase
MAARVRTDGFVEPCIPTCAFKPPVGPDWVHKIKQLKHSPAGIEFNDHIDAGGAAVFRQACAMGLEGVVSKRLSAPYRSGPSRDWIKVKNPG